MMRCSVFYKHRDARFFPSTAWAAAMSVTQIPWAIIEVTLYSLVVYFFVGFYKGAGLRTCCLRMADSHHIGPVPPFSATWRYAI